MEAIHLQCIEDNQEHKVAVILPINDYEKLLEHSEKLEDIRLYNEVKAKNEKSILFNEYLK